MNILMVGGGSGGHTTPIVAVAEKILEKQPQTTLAYIGNRSDTIAAATAKNQLFSRSKLIFAGKLRRYHTDSWLRRITDIRTIGLNIRDMVFIAIGLIQAFCYLVAHRPAIIFIKGGFVGVPVGYAARILRIPYVTHDSDAIPGLANRLIAKGAALHMVALPKEVYPYPQDKTVTVGVPVSSVFYEVAAQKAIEVKASLSLPTNAFVVVVSGGGLGAQRVNEGVIRNAQMLFQSVKSLYIIHQAGERHVQAVKAAYDDILQKDSDTRRRVTVLGFTPDFARYIGAADAVISRAGATTIAEIALVGRPLILIPNPELTGGHQTKNARILQESEAAEVIAEDEIDARLVPTLVTLVTDEKAAAAFSDNLKKLAHPSAAAEVAELLLGKGTSR